VKLAALLCWFDEPVDWLAGCVASLAKARVSHVVAVDGAYGLYPGAMRTWTSPGDQAHVIMETARNLDVGCTVHVPDGPFAGNEVEKRSLAFELGRSTAADWFLVVDADELVLQAPFDLAAALDSTGEDVANVMMVERGDLGGMYPSPRLFRNQPGLRLHDSHYLYVHDLAARGLAHDPGFPAADLLDLRLEHRHRDNWSQRRKAQHEYYELRDELGIERAPEPVVT
jgi:hypothetical protein